MLSRGLDVIETNGGKVVSWMHEVFLLVKRAYQRLLTWFLF